MAKKKLGRTFDTLLPQRQSAEPDQAVAVDGGAASGSGIDEIVISEVTPSPYQPRRHFDEEALRDLANSISASGLLQPIVVREKAQGGYELIAGERRLRASELAGLTSVPAVIKTVTDEEASALALIENMQREDLSALEEAQGIARLRDEFELTQQQIADVVGKSRVAIANALRLLNLGSVAKQMLENGDLEMGHARALLGLEGTDQERAAHIVVEKGLSVRQTEALVRQGLNRQPKAKQPPTKDADIQRLEVSLTDHLGAPVAIKHGKNGGGELAIKYSSLEELDGVLRHLGIKET